MFDGVFSVSVKVERESGQCVSLGYGKVRIVICLFAIGMRNNSEKRFVKRLSIRYAVIGLLSAEKN